MPDENEKPKYRINSYEVPQEEFEKLKSTLTISKEEKWTGEIAPGKGNYYGGNEVSYEAVDPKTSKKYLYTEIDYPHKKN
ncbi:MAG: hypothetical protein HYT34_00390, partial [Candidatus Ryanbacteria bacterium]|nr:hypothetical protein [Candidatus Ryanbacteria bacterium]